MVSMLVLVARVVSLLGVLVVTLSGMLVTAVVSLLGVLVVAPLGVLVAAEVSLPRVVLVALQVVVLVAMVSMLGMLVVVISLLGVLFTPTCKTMNKSVYVHKIEDKKVSTALWCTSVSVYTLKIYGYPFADFLTSKSGHDICCYADTNFCFGESVKYPSNVILHTFNSHSNIQNTDLNTISWNPSFAAVDDHVDCVILSCGQNTLIATLRRTSSCIFIGT